MTTATTGAKKGGAGGALVLLIFAAALALGGGHLNLGGGGSSVVQANAIPTAVNGVALTPWASIPENPCLNAPDNRMAWRRFIRGKQWWLPCDKFRHIVDGHPSYGDTARAIVDCIQKTIANGTMRLLDNGTLYFIWHWDPADSSAVSKVWASTSYRVRTAINSKFEGRWTDCANAPGATS